jgi:hypothetical protein
LNKRLKQIDVSDLDHTSKKLKTDDISTTAKLRNVSSKNINSDKFSKELAFPSKPKSLEGDLTGNRSPNWMGQLIQQ